LAGIPDEILFAIKSKEWTFGKKASFAQGDEKRLALFLSSLEYEISEKGFFFCGIDARKIAAYAKSACAGKKGFSGLASVFSGIKPGEHKAKLGEACEEKCVPLADAYFLKKACEETGCPLNFAGKADAREERPAEDEAVFVGKHGEWFAVKKMSIDATTKRHEIAGILATIDATVRRKMFDFAGIGKEAVEARAAALTKGKRKAYGNLAEALAGVKEGEFKAEEASYLLDRILSNLGFAAWPSTETLSEVYPDLKFAKPRGNFGKKKK
jgi:hypothetical protein